MIARDPAVAAVQKSALENHVGGARERGWCTPAGTNAGAGSAVHPSWASSKTTNAAGGGSAAWSPQQELGQQAMSCRWLAGGALSGAAPEQVTDPGGNACASAGAVGG